MLLSTVTDTKKPFMAPVTSHLSMMHATTGRPTAPWFGNGGFSQHFQGKEQKGRGKNTLKRPKRLMSCP